MKISTKPRIVDASGQTWRPTQGGHFRNVGTGQLFQGPRGVAPTGTLMTPQPPKPMLMPGAPDQFAMGPRNPESYYYTGMGMPSAQPAPPQPNGQLPPQYNALIQALGGTPNKLF